MQILGLSSSSLHPCTNTASESVGLGWNPAICCNTQHTYTHTPQHYTTLHIPQTCIYTYLHTPKHTYHIYQTHRYHTYHRHIHIPQTHTHPSHIPETHTYHKHAYPHTHTYQKHTHTTQHIPQTHSRTHNFDGRDQVQECIKEQLNYYKTEIIQCK